VDLFREKSGILVVYLRGETNPIKAFKIPGGPETHPGAVGAISRINKVIGISYLCNPWVFQTVPFINFIRRAGGRGNPGIGMDLEVIPILRGQLPQKTFDIILSAADVVALPYEISSQSGILAHCLAFGKPVVTSGTEVMKEIIGGHDAGIVCDTREAYIEGICHILSDPKLADRLSSNARTYVRESIAWSRVAERHIQLYKSIMDIPKVDSHIILVE